MSAKHETLINQRNKNYLVIFEQQYKFMPCLKIAKGS